MRSFLRSWAGWSTLAVLSAAASAQSSLPTVDLGYEIHQAISLNETSQVYNFSNIRYAQPPVGELRFARPKPPVGRATAINNGSVGVVCPQASPAWSAIGAEFMLAYALGLPFNFTAAVASLEASNATAPPPDPRTTEDCLFLDVFVPKAVFNSTLSNSTSSNSTSSNSTSKGAPVLVWIYGGGYTLGSKDGSGNPNGLIQRSQANGTQGIIFVELNYRLGALGWLAGPTLQASGGVSNAALYDQRLALQWVQRYIHLFGGDPNRVTVMGESAGGGSIVHQITAYGGLVPPPFQQAIPQSAAWLPLPSNFIQENTTQTFLALLNVTTIAEARNLSSKAVIAANAAQIGAAPYGTFVYGPVVDGSFVPQLPPLLLNQGAFYRNLTLMVGHNTDEGPLFTNPTILTDDQLLAYLRASYPGVEDSVVDYVVKVLYPAIYDGRYPYKNPLERTILIVTESVFSCNSNYLDRAFGNKTYTYQFAVPPAFHGWDVVYTFYDGVAGAENVIPQVAEAFQGYIVDFVKTGNPNGNGLPKFPTYGPNSIEQAINITIGPIKDPTANARCWWWQKSLFY